MNMIKTALLLAGTWAMQSASSQAPALAWEEFFEGSLPGQDIANDLLIDDGDNVYVTGIARHQVQQGTATTIRYSPAGDQLMADHIYGPSQAVDNIGRALAQDQWGHVYVTGLFSANEGDFLLAKYSGNQRLWRENYEAYSFGSDIDQAYDLAVAPDGSIYMVGSITSLSGMMLDNFILRTDSAGEQLWTAQTGISSGDEWATCVGATSDGHAYMGGHWWNMDVFGADAAVARFASDGSMVWDEAFASPTFDDRITDLIVTPEDHVIICGAVSNGNDLDLLVLARDAEGTLLWEHQIAGTAGENDEAVKLALLSDGRVAVTGTVMMTSGGTSQPTIITIAIDGDELGWTDLYAGENELGASASDIAVGDQDRIVVAGRENSTAGTDGTILSYTAAGDLQWNIAHDGGAGLNDRFNAVGLNSFGDVVATGTSHTTTAESRYITVQYGNTVGVDDPAKEDLITLFPSISPVGTPITVRPVHPDRYQLNIRDGLGRSIGNSMASGNSMITLPAPGLYTVEVHQHGITSIVRAVAY
jgi:hypothetical protein